MVGQKGCEHCTEQTTHAGDRRHQWMPSGDPFHFFAVCYDIDSSSNGDERVVRKRYVFGEFCNIPLAFTGIDAARLPVGSGNGCQFAGVAA